MGALIMMLTDATIGDPQGLPHPVVGIGKIISWWEVLFYAEQDQRFRGFHFTVMVVATTLGFAWTVHYGLSFVPYGWILESILCGWFLAAKTLAGVASRMEKRFQAEGLEGARKLIAEFVSRDTDSLSEIEILRATVETMAENLIDGVLAPIFFFYVGLAFGSPLMGIVFYKTVNTLDSMVGYRNKRYQKFGRFSAKLDDVVNWIPARIGSLIILAAGVFNKGNIKQGFKTMLNDRHLHASPNSAYAEAAVAGLYGCRLGGPSIYFGINHSRPWIGESFESPTWDILKQVKGNIWISEILFVLMIEGGILLWA